MTHDHARKIEGRLTKLEQTIEDVDRDRTEWILLILARMHLAIAQPTAECLRVRANVADALDIRTKHMMREAEVRPDISDLLKTIIGYLDDKYKHREEV